MGNKKGLLLVIAGAAAALAAAATVAIYVKSKLDSEQKLICEMDNIEYEIDMPEQAVPADNAEENNDKITEPEITIDDAL